VTSQFDFSCLIECSKDNPAQTPDGGETVMKQLKTLGVPAMAAFVVAAGLAAPSTAAATTTALCKVNQEPCKAENQYPSGTAVKWRLVAGTTATFAGMVEHKCSGSTIESKTTAATASPLPLSITAVILGPCAGCSSWPAINLPWEGGLTTEGGGSTLTLSKKGSSVGWAMTNCQFGINCTMTTTSMALETVNLESGTPRIKAVKEPLTVTGSPFCGTSETWTAEYEIVAPDPVYVST
jgi:hypothetical protein